MSKFNDWQKAKTVLSAAKAWLSNKDKIHRGSNENYSLRINTGASFLQYCGQASEGANNYHSAPEHFNSAVEQAIKNNAETIFNDALDILAAKESQLAKDSRKEVVAMLSEIDGE